MQSISRQDVIERPDTAETCTGCATTVDAADTVNGTDCAAIDGPLCTECLAQHGIACPVCGTP